MTYDAINELIVSAESSGYEKFREYDGAFQDGKFERVLSFLRTNHEEEMASVYACGIHDYANEKYQGNYDYPEE